MAKVTATTAVVAYLTASIAAEKQPAASENYVELLGTVSSNVDTAATTVDTVTIPSDVESVSASDSDDLVTFIASSSQLDTVTSLPKRNATREVQTIVGVGCEAGVY